MDNNTNKQFNTLKGNKGATLVTVIIAIMFIGILGSSLLYTTLTGSHIKASERDGKQNFYDADTAMDLILTGIQEMAAVSAGVAFEDLLTDYDEYSNMDPFDATVQFSKIYLDHLCDNGELQMSQLGKAKLFLSAHEYDVEVIEDYLKYVIGDIDGDEKIGFPNKYFIEISATNGDKGLFDKNETKKRVVLEDLSLTYNDLTNNHTTKVTTDILVKAPDFNVSQGGYTVSNIPDYAIIATNTFKPASSTTIKGSAYFGEIDSDQGGTELIFSDGMLVCKGNVNIDGTELTIEDSVNLWSKDITVYGEDSLLDLDGYSFVKDDLNLEQKASAIIKGVYTGFGKDASSAESSSAILINGTDVDLDLQDVDALTLAGQSFITGYSSTAFTGESISVKSNQRAYLIPLNMLNNGANSAITSNPMVVHEDDVEYYNSPTLNDEDILFEINGVGKKPSDYGINAVSVLTVPIQGNKKVMYYFMKFPSVARASEYFKDYFNANRNQMTTYLKMYLNSYKAPALGEMITSGVGLSKDINDDYILTDPSIYGGIGGKISGLENAFSKLVKTLSSTKDSSKNDPYEYIVNETNVRTFVDSKTFSQEYRFKDEDGKTTAILINFDGYEFVSSSEENKDVSIILVTPGKNIKVSGSFEGLILVDGNLTSANGTITANSDAVREALHATFNGDANETKFDYFFSNESGLDAGDDSTSNEDSNWDLNKLVGYDNWKKD